MLRLLQGQWTWIQVCTAALAQLLQCTLSAWLCTRSQLGYVAGAANYFVFMIVSAPQRFCSAACLPLHACSLAGPA